MFFILGYFSSFTPLTAKKIKISNKQKKKTQKKKTPGDIIILHKAAKNHDLMLYCSWDMAHNRCNCYLWFWAIFALLSPNSLKNENLKKIKKRLKISLFYTFVPKIICYTVPEIWCMTDVTIIFHFSFWAIICLFTSPLPPSPPPCNIFHFGLFFALLPP